MHRAWRSSPAAWATLFSDQNRPYLTRYRYKFSDTEVTEKIVEVRRYVNYRFFDTRTDERLGELR